MIHDYLPAFIRIVIFFIATWKTTKGYSNQAFPSISSIVRHAVDDIPGTPNTSRLHLGVLCSSSTGAHGMLSVSF